MDLVDDCHTCGEEVADWPDEQCKLSLRECGHHCNHSRSHDQCCWCRWEVPTE